MQIVTGLVNVTNGSSTVQGNNAVDWSQVTTDCLFIHANQTYEINAINLGTSQLTISPPFAGATATDQSYVIVRDFTVNLSLPLLNPGDLEAAAIISRMAYILDATLGSGATGDPVLGEILITKNSHGFIVGNFLTLSGSTWVLAASDSSANANVVGVVREVVSSNQFKLVTQGYIQGIAGITLTSGTTYYLRSSSVSGGGGQVNITSNVAFVGIQVPLLMADSPSSGYLLNSARAAGGIFAQDLAGLVPGPTASDISNGRVLSASGWVSGTTSVGSILSQHLNTSAGIVDWTSFLAGGANLSVFKHINDLHTRVSAYEQFTRRIFAVTLRRDRVQTGTTPYEVKSFTIPARVSTIKLYCYSGEYNKPGSVYVPSSPAGGGKGYVPAHVEDIENATAGVCLLLDVVPGDVVSADIGPAYALANVEDGVASGAHGLIILKKNAVEFARVRTFLNYRDGSAKKTYRAVETTGSDVTLLHGLSVNGQEHKLAYGIPASYVSGVFSGYQLDDAYLVIPRTSTPVLSWSETGSPKHAGFARIEYTN